MSINVKTGQHWKMKRQVILTDYHLGGIVERARPRINVDEVEEEGTGQHQLALVKSSEILPSIEFTLKVQRLENYIADYSNANKYCFIDEEDTQDLVTNMLTFTDGLDSYKFLGGTVIDSCRLEIPQRGSIKAAIRALGRGMVTQAYGSDPSAITDEPLTKENVNTLTVGGISIINDFQRISISVNHGAEQKVLGNTKTVSDIIQRGTKYNIEIVRALKTQSWQAAALGGTKQDVVLQINDNNTPTRKTKFTFADADITTREETVEELGMIVESITAKGKSLVLAAGA